MPEVSAEGTAFANHGESSAPAPPLVQTENFPSASDASIPDQLAKPRTVRELPPMSSEHPQEPMPERMPIKTKEAYVQRQASGTETAAGRPGQGRPRTAQEFARNTGNRGEQTVTTDIKTREAVLQAQTHNAEAVSQRGPEYAHQESARETPGSQIQESPRELRKTVRTREGLIEEPKPVADEYGSAVNAPSNVRGSDIAGASRDDIVHGSRIESGDTGTALPHPDAPASLTAEQRTPDIKTRTAYAQRDNRLREEPSSRTVEQGRQHFVRERKRQADRKLAAEHGSGIADKGILDDGTAVTEETRAIAAEQETRIQGLKTKEAWLRQHGLDRPRERIADIHSGKNTAGTAGKAGFPVSLSGQNGANLKGKIPELPSADASHFPVKSAAETGRFIREKGAAAVRNTVSSGGKAVKAVRPVVIKEAGKTGSKAIKTAEQTAEKGVRTAARESAKMAQKAAQAAKASAKAKAVKDAAVKAAKQGVRTIKDVGKAVAAAAKAAIAALSSLLAGLSASSIVVAVVLVVICLIGLLVATPFGLFLSGQTGVGEDNIQAAVSRLTGEYNARLQEIQEDIPHDELDMAPDIVSAMTGNWKNVLAVYAVCVTTDEFSATEVVTMTDEKMEILRETFWDMNAISYRTTRRTEGSGEDAVTIVTLHISPDTKDAEDMAEEYHFNAKQKKLLEELLSPEYDELFDALLSGNHALVPGDLDGVLIPGDISETRRQIVETGSQLIGQIHYFWGGKSLVLGWDSRWGTPTRVWAAGSPSTGTVRPYGLDCSGYVDWVFYNVSGGTYVIGLGGGASAQHS
ncbi:MAG: hypothetical protein IJT94_12145 [Oscillibacter sp.]|nr:hypothetical protein [Oscillibacter sp.]